MKKLLNFILLNLGLTLSLNAGEVLHIKKDKLKELNKEFRDSINFLKSKNQKIMEERANKIANYQAKVQEFENVKELSPKQKEELERLELELQNYINLQNEELYKASLVFENKIDADIKEALKKLVTNVPVIEGEVVLYGGKDITKELLDVLNGKDVKKITSNFSSKIYSFDIDQFNSKYKGAKDIKKYIEQKMEEIKNKQKEYHSKMNDKDFNQEEVKKTLRAMHNEFTTTNQVMQEKLVNDVEQALAKIASVKKIDLVILKRALYSEVPSITDEVIKELEKAEESKEIKNNSSLIGFLNYEVFISKYKKHEEKKKEFENKNREFEKVLEEKINQIQKIKDSDKTNSKKAEIEKLEYEFDQLRAIKSQQLQQLYENVKEELLNDIKAAAKIVGNKKKLELIVIKSRGNNNTILYAGQDVTQDILNILSNR